MVYCVQRDGISCWSPTFGHKNVFPASALPCTSATYCRGSTGASIGFPNSSQSCFAAHSAASSLFLRASCGETATGLTGFAASIFSSSAWSRSFLRLASARSFCSGESQKQGPGWVYMLGAYSRAAGPPRSGTWRLARRLAYVSHHPGSIPDHPALRPRDIHLPGPSMGSSGASRRRCWSRAGRGGCGGRRLSGAGMQVSERVWRWRVGAYYRYRWDLKHLLWWMLHRVGVEMLNRVGLRAWRRCQAASDAHEQALDGFDVEDCGLE